MNGIINTSQMRIKSSHNRFTSRLYSPKIGLVLLHHALNIANRFLVKAVGVFTAELKEPL